MRKWFLGLGFFFVANTAWCGFLISHTPAIEGRVTDTETGEPIEYAIVEVQWKRPVLALESTYKTSKTLFAATDKDGRYIIPSSWHWWTPWNLEGFRMWVRHPLYEGKEEFPYLLSAYREFVRKHRRGKTLVYEVELEPIHKKYDIPMSFDYHYFEGAMKLEIDPRQVVPNWDVVILDERARDIRRVIGKE